MKSYLKRGIKNLVSSILVVLIFFLLFISFINHVFNWLYIETQVKGHSMQPTINSNVLDSTAKGDAIYINQYSSFTNNDIVVAKVDWPNVDYIIKRVIGKPGDKIQIKDQGNCYTVFVNDEVLYHKEKYGDQYSIPKTGSYGYYDDYLAFLRNPEFKKWHNNKPYILLGENDYFLMGDNWGHTTDSIEKGPVKTNDIIGKVDLIVDVTNDNPFTKTLFYLKKLFSIN